MQIRLLGIREITIGPRRGATLHLAAHDPLPRAAPQARRSAPGGQPRRRQEPASNENSGARQAGRAPVVSDTGGQGLRRSRPSGLHAPLSFARMASELSGSRAEPSGGGRAPALVRAAAWYAPLVFVVAYLV